MHQIPHTWLEKKTFLKPKSPNIPHHNAQKKPNPPAQTFPSSQNVSSLGQIEETHHPKGDNFPQENEEIEQIQAYQAVS